MSEFITRYSKDYSYTQLLIAGDSRAWERFYKEFRKKLEVYINRKYPNIFSYIAIEEIFDGVGKRLIDNDYKPLRDYRGECSLAAYITRATEWEIKDWLRKHSGDLMGELLDGHEIVDTSYKTGQGPNSFFCIPEQEELPEPIKSLNDDLRFAFLLRYYDYFGFPVNEIRLLAKIKNISIGRITEKIVKFFDPGQEDILDPQREKEKAFYQRLEKLCTKIQQLDIREHKISQKGNHNPEINELQKISDCRSELERKREILLKEKAKFIATTPYEVIAEILGEGNVSTIRSRVFLAKKQLARQITAKTG